MTIQNLKLIENNSYVAGSEPAGDLVTTNLRFKDEAGTQFNLSGNNIAGDFFAELRVGKFYNIQIQ